MKKKEKYSILIDLDRLKDPFNGLGQVALNLAEQLSQIKDERLEFTLLVPDAFVGKFGSNIRYATTSAKRRHLPFLYPSYDLWYTIHQDSWFFPFRRKTPYILTINDLNFVEEKTGFHLWYRTNRLQLKVNHARTIVVISRHTENMIRQHLHVNKKDIRVIYCGVKVNTFENPAKPAFVPEGEILFTVGVIQPKKNLSVLIGFMKELPERYVLVMAGNKQGSYSAEMEKKIRELKLEQRIIMPGLISDEDKYWLYRNCKAVLFPSKREGMGFPPVEAMRCGKPVFASTFSSIPEVSGDKACYWETLEPEPMARFFLEKITEFDKDPARPEILRQHSMLFTWENSVKELVQLFREVLNCQPRL